MIFAEKRGFANVKGSQACILALRGNLVAAQPNMVQPWMLELITRLPKMLKGGEDRLEFLLIKV
jgi:hypothetical protein